MIADMQATLVGGEDRMAEGVVAPANAIPDDDAVLGVDEDGGYGDDDQDNDDDDDDDDMDEDSAHGSDADAASLDSAVSDEYAWGDHVSSRNAFVYNDDESLSDESGEGDDAGAGAGAMERRRQNGMLRARRSILSFLRSH